MSWADPQIRSVTACQDRSPGVHCVGGGLRGRILPQHVRAPPSPAPPSLMEEGRQEGCFTGSISGLWKAWQGSSRKPGNLEGNSHSPPRPGDPPTLPGAPSPSPRDAALLVPALGSTRHQACPMGSRHVLGAHGPVGRSHLARQRPLPATGGQPGVSRVPRGMRGPRVTAHGTGRQPRFTPPAHQRGASVGSTHTRTRLLRCRSRKRGKSVHPRGHSERLLPRAGPDDSVVSAPSARSQQGPRQLVASAVPAPETHRSPGGSAKWL